MSATFSIACMDCEQHLWIGQSSKPGPVRLYSTEPYQKALAEFLTIHKMHCLLFGDNTETDIATYEEIEVAACAPGDDQSTLSKLNKMVHGRAQVFRPDELDVARAFDIGKVIKLRRGVYYEAWIEKEDRDSLLGHLPKLDL